MNNLFMRYSIFMFSILMMVYLGACVKKNKKAIEDDAKLYSPDISFNKIYYSHLDSLGRSDIYQINPSDVQPVNITQSDDLEELFPCISHDGERLAFVANEKIYHRSISTSDLTELTGNGIFSTSPFSPTFLSWSDKSNFITFHDTSALSKIHYLDTDYDTDIERFLSEGFEQGSTTISNYPSFSTKELKICFVSYSEITKLYQLFIGPPSGYLESSELKEVFVSDQPITQPAFSKNGEQIGFLFQDNVCTIDTTGENFQSVTQFRNDVLINGFSFSPEGKQIVFAAKFTETSTYDLFLVETESKLVSRLLETPHSDELTPFWN